ncbi:hypothetical protein TNCV_960571, partial [Trichonephila clavipes]
NKRYNKRVVVGSNLKVSFHLTRVSWLRRQTRIKESGVQSHKKKRSNLSKKPHDMGDDVMEIHASQSDESLMDDLSPRPSSSGSLREHVRRFDDFLYLLELPWSKNST